MRTMFAIAAIAAVFVVAAWSHNPTIAVAQQTGTSMDIASITAGATDLPTQQYDAF